MKKLNGLSQKDDVWQALKIVVQSYLAALQLAKARALRIRARIKWLKDGEAKYKYCIRALKS